VLAEYFNVLPEVGESMFCPAFHTNCRQKHVSSDRADQMPFSQMMSRRGLYSYDRNYRETSYYRVSLPSRGLRVMDLPEEIAIVLSRNHLPSVHFDRSIWIVEADLEKLGR
jgi:hypothetical protein